jgi:aerobic carbon-monoxide dehydrogenase large subunit
LEVITYFDPPDFNFPFGTHIALVEIDESTGHIDIVRYVAVDDVGTVGNPMVVEGQVHGNIALGIGQALLEQAVYDSSGQLLTDGFLTYAMPRATHMPNFELDRTVTPTPHNPLGAKGAGDVSNPAVAPAIVNAICDALTDLGIKHIDMPVTSEKIWRIMQDRVHG